MHRRSLLAGLFSLIPVSIRRRGAVQEILFVRFLKGEIVDGKYSSYWPTVPAVLVEWDGGSPDFTKATQRAIVRWPYGGMTYRCVSRDPNDKNLYHLCSILN